MSRAGRLLFVLLLCSAAFLPTRAQNTGALPYLDSEHDYAITIGKATNEKQWVVTDKDGANVNTPYTITDATQAGFSWFVIIPAETDGGTEQVNITFDRSVFAPGATVLPATWYLQYYEYETQSDGTTICTSAREFVLTVSENEFYLTVGTDYAQCNDESGAVHTYALVDNDPAGTDLYATEVTYTVTMHKETNYDPDSWTFDADFSQAPSAFAAAVSTVDGGSALSTESGGTYTVNVFGPNGGADPFPDEVDVTLTVSFENPVLADVTPTLTVSNGTATVNGTPPAVTYDNEDIYPLDNVGDRLQTVTIRAIPATRDIVHDAAEGETLWSSQNPLQNSTHNYTVQMGDPANYARSTWHLIDDVAAVVDVADYSITATADVSNADVELTFNMTPGDYTLVFTEVDEFDCSTIRHYDFTLGDAFDVDIEAVSDLCADISDEVNNTPGTATNTEVTYVVNLLTGAYKADWEFTFSLAGAPVFSSDLQVSSIVVNTVGAAYTSVNGTSGNIAVSNSEASPLNSVSITVTYNGFYDAAHTITASLSNISGSYSEADADAANEITHLIYKLPQPLVLEGVD